MPADPQEALLALQSCLFALDRYGQDHGSTMAGVRHAAETLNHAAAQSPVFFVFFADRVIAGGATVPKPERFLPFLGAKLKQHGLQALRARAPLTTTDVLTLAAALAQPPHEHAAELGSPALRATTLASQLTAAQDAQHRPRTIAHDTATLADVHQQLLQGHASQAASLEAIAANVMTVFAGQNAAMLELVEIERHDQYTMAHSVNVAVMAGALASAVGITGDPLEHLVIAALLHDIGKREVPASILLKPAPLTDQERGIVLTHPASGARVLLDRPDIPPMASVVAYEHHRRLDGKGYPERPSAPTPTLASQIVQIADIYDALRTHRPYRSALSARQAAELMLRDAGKAFDGPLFEVFYDIVVRRLRPRPADSGETKAA